MNLTDKETLELSELCSALADGTLTGVQRERLSDLLKSSEEARRFYVRHSSLSASLFDYAAEMQTESPDASETSAKIISFPGNFLRPALAAAAALALAAGGWLFFHNDSAEATGDVDTALVAQITGTHDCAWSRSQTLQPGANLQQGQTIELESGEAEITFDCGAMVVLQGPAALELNSAWEATLHHGTLRANVPHEAVGFRILQQSVDVVDLGTEFTLTASRDGRAEVRVIKGSVQTAPRGGPENQKMVLHENQTGSFGPAGYSAVPVGKKSAPPLATLPRFARFAAPVSFAHWSFDESEGPVARAERDGRATKLLDASIQTTRTETALAGPRSDGKFGRALDFDGSRSARISIPGFSTSSPRTLSFWLKIPADVRLNETSAAVGWAAAAAGKFPARAVQIGWNAAPSQGPLGALRLDIGDGRSIGTSDLRDGNWHHIAVVFVPHDRGSGKLHVRSYVDGRLELAGVRGDKKKMKHQRGELSSLAANALWLGRGAVQPSASAGNFRGALDELFIADRALTSPEIKHLMRDNAPPARDAIAAAP